ncbi:hypothetical protein [Chryseoglobus sp. 28M-23]|uniref:hypothetical protein n=1 Tax=Chryseoglobus sp. 28M-23 TaxID=2772253 RepID=UPI0017471911|nr:hypothetical protein [Chryseoglobus sp. 28M-23]QOD93988.1 hypothetical protein IE160_01755 [Chryseoglobus sp. 28M-23]
MKKFRSIALVVALALGSGALLAAPAHAAPQTLFGTTVDTVAQPSGESVLGDTAHVLSIGSSVDSTLGAARGLDVVVTLRENGTDLVTCTIPAGSLSCSLFTGDLLAPGTHAVSLVASSSGRDVVIAYFPFDVPEVPVEAEFAATGAVGEGALALGSLALLGGGLLLVAAAHRRRSARAA